MQDQLKSLSAVCSHFNDLEIKEDTTKADGASSVGKCYWGAAESPHPFVYLHVSEIKSQHPTHSVPCFAVLTAEVLLLQTDTLKRLDRADARQQPAFFFFYCFFNY